MSNSDFIYFNPIGETPFLLSEAKKKVGMTKKAVRLCAAKGRLNYATGEIVKLEMCRLHNGVGSTLEAIARFMARLNEMPE